MSEWPTTGVALNHKSQALFHSPATFVVTVLDPLDSDVENTAAVPVAWSFSPGTQQTYRIEVFETDLVTLKYDSGIVASAVLSATIPEGSLDNLSSYELMVTVTTTDSTTGESEFIAFSTSWAPSGPVPGPITVTAFGDKCDVGVPPDLPHFRVGWGEVSPGPTETFVRYSVWRRENAGTWERITSIATVATVIFDDYNVKSYTVYEYAVTWTATSTTTGDSLTSSRQDPPTAGRIEFDLVFIHDVTSPRANHVVFYSHDSRVGLNVERRFERAWGRQEPTGFIGEHQWRTVSINGLPDLHRGDVWREMVSLVTRERTAAAVLAVRLGFSGELLFCQSGSTNRANRERTNVPTTELSEVFYLETVD